MDDFRALSDSEQKLIEENGGVPAHILKDLHGSIKFMNLAGNCLELFVPTFLGALSNVITSFERSNENEADG